MPAPPDQNPPTQLLVPYDVLGQTASFASEDEAKWWRATGPMLCKLLINSNYDIHSQYKFLSLYREYGIPALGPYPDGVTGTNWKSAMNRAGLPVEFSYNFSQAVVRVAIEPVGPFAGTERDQFNTKAVWEYLETLSRRSLGIDLQLFRAFAENLVAGDEELETILDNADTLKAIGPWKTQTLTAMDLRKSGHFLMKAYLYPQIKSIVTGVPIQKLLFDAIRKVDVDGTLAHQLSHIEEYIESRQPKDEGVTPSVDGLGLSVDASASFFPYFIACDLIGREKSRIKFYAGELQVDLKVVEDVWTFGGQRTDPDALAGLRLLKDLWHLLSIEEGFRVPPTDFCETGKPASRDIPMMFHFELDQYHAFPEPQVYIPVFGENDLAIVDGLAAFFDRQGWAAMAKNYKPNFLSYYPNIDLTHATHICAWVSFSYKKGFPYLSVYHHSFVPDCKENGSTVALAS